MNPSLVILIVVIIVAIVIAVPVIIGYFSDTHGRVTNSQKQELRDLRAVVRRIEVLAAQNKGINDADSILADQIENEIYTYKTKELS